MKNKTQYIKSAQAEGAAIGKYVASLKYHTANNAKTIHSAAVSFVNSLPLNNIALEEHLVNVFENAANAEI